MGEHIHNWSRWQFRLWENVIGEGCPELPQSSMGSHFIDGNTWWSRDS